jgi:membrane-associated protein
MDLLLHPQELIRTFGYAGIFFIIFAESGLFFGFFFPGDSLLLTAGLLAFHGELDLRVLIPGVFICAVLGDNVGYWFGKSAGPLIFRREESLFFKPRYLQKAKEFYDRHGGITIVVARFMPIIRTFAPIVAGAAEMAYRRFFFFNLLGGLLWGIGVTSLGYVLADFLSKTLSPEQFDRYFTIIIISAFIIPGLPTVWHLWNENRVAILSRIRSLLSPGHEPEA